jgi:phage terminase small subunit
MKLIERSGNMEEKVSSNTTELSTGKYAYLDKDLRTYYMTLGLKYRKFIDYRGQGFTLENSWISAGFNSKNAKSLASQFVHKNPSVEELIKQIQTHNRLMQLNDPESTLSKEIMNNAKKAKTALDYIKEAKGEEAVSLKFYQDVINGRVKQTKKTTTTDKEGNQVTKVEEIEPSITERMKAREKLDLRIGIDGIANKAVGEVEFSQGLKITIFDPSDKALKEESLEAIHYNENEDAIDAEYEEVEDDGNAES